MTAADRQAQADAQRHRDEAARLLTLRAIEMERNAAKRQEAGQQEQSIASRFRKAAGLRQVAAELVAQRPDWFPVPAGLEQAGATGAEP